MEPFTASLRDGKLILEIDERQFLADATRNSANNLTLVDRQQFLDFVREHIFTLTHDLDESGAHPSWWLRLSEALAKAAAAQNRGVRERHSFTPTCGCDPEVHDGG